MPSLVGSEMCIRDSAVTEVEEEVDLISERVGKIEWKNFEQQCRAENQI